MKHILFSVLCLAAFASCTKNQDTPASQVTANTASNLAASGSDGHYAFYSLESGQAVAVSDSASAKWDIGFRTTTVITNGGTSGPGKGGAFVQRGTTFDAYTVVAKDSSFRVDAAGVFAVTTGSGNGWYNYNTSTNIISPIPGNILVIRTASGKFAKVEITSYYQNSPVTPDVNSVPRYYSFRSAFQANGTSTF